MAPDGTRWTRSYAALLVLLLVLYLFHRPLADHLPILTVFLFYAPLSYGVRLASPPRSLKAPFWLLVLCGLTFDLFVSGTAVEHSTVLIANAVTKLLILVVVMAAILRHVLRVRRVTLDLVMGACCVYFLVSLAWTLVFMVITEIEPAAFSFPETPAGEAQSSSGTPEADEQLTQKRFSKLFYFSMVTLTTLGYGDITPRTQFTRMLAALEAFSGQLYLAIAIAYLVGLGLANSQPEPDE